MSNRVNFIPVCDSLSQVQFESKCSFCNVFTNKVSNNFCFSCARVLNSLRENDILLISYKPYWVHIGQKKAEYNMAWHDFEQLEDSITEIVESLSFLSYEKNNLFFYLDIHNISEKLDKTCKVFTEINDFINQEFHTTYNYGKKLNHNFQEYFENLESSISSNKFLYLTTEEAKASTQPSSLSISRHKLKDIFIDKFVFD